MATQVGALLERGALLFGALPSCSEGHGVRKVPGDRRVLNAVSRQPLLQAGSAVLGWPTIFFLSEPA